MQFEDRHEPHFIGLRSGDSFSARLNSKEALTLLLATTADVLRLCFLEPQPLTAAFSGRIASENVHSIRYNLPLFRDICHSVSSNIDYKTLRCSGVLVFIEVTAALSCPFRTESNVLVFSSQCTDDHDSVEDIGLYNQGELFKYERRFPQCV